MASAARQLLVARHVLSFSSALALRQQPAAAPLVRRLATAVVVPHDDRTQRVDQLKRVTSPGIPTPSKELKQELAAFCARIGCQFKDPVVLLEAITFHARNKQFNNQRLSLLGESTLVQWATEYCFVHFPKLPKVGLRDMRSHVNSEEVLATTAKSIGLPHVLQTRKGTTATDKDLSDGFRSLVGGILIDQGNSAARQFLRLTLQPVLDEIDVNSFVRVAHPRLMLRHMLAAKNMAPPRIDVIDESGRHTHLPTFRCGVYSGDTLLGEATSYSLKKAEQAAAREALTSFFGEALLDAPLPSDLEDYVPEAQIKLRDADE